jgi:endo-1,4-beta-mannosidase
MTWAFGKRHLSYIYDEKVTKEQARFLRHLLNACGTAIMCHEWVMVSKQIAIHQGFLIAL